MGKVSGWSNANRVAFISIEKITNGFMIIEPAGNKYFKASMNGVVKYLEEAFGVSIIEKDDSPKTDITIAQIFPEKIEAKESKPKSPKK